MREIYYFSTPTNLVFPSDFSFFTFVVTLTPDRLGEYILHIASDSSFKVQHCPKNIYQLNIMAFLFFHYYLMNNSIIHFPKGLPS